MKKGLAYPLFSFRNRVLIIVLGLVIGISSLLFTNDMARQLREKEQNEVAIWSAAFRDPGRQSEQSAALGADQLEKQHPVHHRRRADEHSQLASDTRPHPQPPEPETQKDRGNGRGQFLHSGHHDEQRDVLHFLRRVAAAQDAGLFSLHPADDHRRVRHLRLHHVPLEQAGRAEPASGSGWPRRRPISSGRPPRRCWAGSSTCARSPSTRRPSKR